MLSGAKQTIFCHISREINAILSRMGPDRTSISENMAVTIYNRSALAFIPRTRYSMVSDRYTQNDTGGKLLCMLSPLRGSWREDKGLADGIKIRQSQEHTLTCLFTVLLGLNTRTAQMQPTQNRTYSELGASRHASCYGQGELCRSKSCNRLDDL